MNDAELIMNNTEQYFREYHYPSTGTLSGHGLSPQGLEEYVRYVKESDTETFNNATAHISYDPHCTPRFDKKFLGELGDSLANHEGRGIHIMYRANHTVSLLKEGGTVLFLDSYNAYPAPDADHLPLLEFIRTKFPSARIHTLHDKIQSDYHNCAFFATQSAGAIEKYLQHKGVSLAEFIQTLDTHKVHQPTLECPNDTHKIKEYARLGIETVPVPPQLVPFAQSLSLAHKIAAGSKVYKEHQPWLPFGSYAGELGNFSMQETLPNKKKLTQLNVNVAVKNDVFRFACLDGQTPGIREKLENNKGGQKPCYHSRSIY